MSGIYWLASYPKSGNTWFRAFLTTFLAEPGKPLDINDLIGGPISSCRQMFEQTVGCEAELFSHEEAEAMLPDVLTQQARADKNTRYQKTHHAYTKLPDGRMMLPTAVTKGAIYFVRNPLDVCVSLMHHNAIDAAEIVRRLNQPDHSLGSSTRRPHLQMRHFLGSWSEHVKSWIDQHDFPVHLMRYEDMKAKPVASFRAALSFLGFQSREDELLHAIERASFAKLRAQEEEKGFRDKPRRAQRFFREGRAGGWQEVLSRRQAEQILEAHAPVIARLGYDTAI